jgi:glycosyltransferase involved in cell wall biosynthesis
MAAAGAVVPAPDTRKTIFFCEGNTDGTIGGSYYSLLFLVEGLRGTCYRPVVAFYGRHRLIPRFEAAGAEVLVFERPSAVRLVAATVGGGCVRRAVHAVGRAAQRGLNGVGFLATAVRYARVLRRHAVRLVHLNNSVARSHEWMLAAALTRTPCVVHERGINVRLPLVARGLARGLARVICISEAVRDSLLALGLRPEQLRVIYNGLDPDRVAAARDAGEVRAELGIDERRRVIGLVGNIKAWKGQEVVVRALPAVAARVPDVLCLFVGATAETDRDYADRLERLVGELGVADRVRFTGPVSNVADYLAVMEVAVHASIAPEPFGRVLLEAMAMRRPVVGSRGGAVPEIVDHDRTGFTFTPGDHRALAGHLIDLLGNPGKARALGEAGYARLVERFHIGRNVASTVSLYAELLGARHG